MYSIAVHTFLSVTLVLDVGSSSVIQIYFLQGVELTTFNIWYLEDVLETNLLWEKTFVPCLVVMCFVY